MYESIISLFQIPGRPLSAERFGAGLINDTVLCEFSDAGGVRKYILQRINAQNDNATAYRTRAIPFPRPEGVRIERIPETQYAEVLRLAELDDEIADLKHNLSSS